jgi:Ricin-type beta-trefoil lectin domain-like/HYR domain/Secretion system C-terminal sorting domain/Lectin C-type domain
MKKSIRFFTTFLTIVNMNNTYNNTTSAMKLVLSCLLFLLPFTQANIFAQCAPAPVSRVASNAKSTNTNIYDDIAFVMTNLLGRGTEASWVLETGGTFVENSDKTATFKGVIKQFGDYPTPHRFQVNLTFSGQTFTAPTGSPYNNTGVSSAAWYYYTGLSGTLTGLGGLAGGVINITPNIMHAFQVGIGADQIPDEPLDLVANGGKGWIEWAIASQPTDPNLQFTTYNALTNIADIALLLSGTPSVSAPVCTAAAGTVAISNVNLALNNGTATIAGAATTNSTVPTGYQIGYVLTKGANKTIVQTSTTPSFSVSDTGAYCVHVLVYNPSTLNLSTVQLGTTTAAQVLSLVASNCICAALNATGNCVTVSKPAGPIDPCAGIVSIRQINNTATNCGSGTPYVMFYNAEYYVAGADLVFTEYANGTATITGKVVKNGISYAINVLYSGKTTVAPSMSPKLQLCATDVNTNNGAGWTYYTTMSGTIQTPSGICNVARRGPSFQLGNFGNLQQSTFGASGWFTGCGTTEGDFNFNIGNTLACSGTNPVTCVVPVTPVGWSYLGSFNNSNYYKFLAADAVYADAKAKVLSIGGRLPIIKTAAQNAFIQSKLNGGNAWVGLYRNGTGWIAADGTTPTYYNWNAGEPNNWGGNEDAVQMYSTGLWNDIAATGANWTIAEVPCTTTTNANPCDNDTQAPAFASVPANISLTTTTTCAAATFATPIATDNCGTPSVSSNYASGFCFPIGVSTVTFTAKDAKGNVKTTSFTVTVTAAQSACATTFDPTKCYKIVNKLSGKVLDVYGGSSANDTRVVQWNYNGTANQQWQFTPVTGGYFKIGSRNSNKNLACHQTANGSTVYQYDYYAGGYKDWKVECVSGGYVKITHRASGKVLDVSGFSTADGAKVQIWDCGNNTGGNDNQLWKIVEVACAAPKACLVGTPVFEATATAEASRSRIEFLTNEGAQADYFTVKKANPTTGIFETLEVVNNFNTTSSDIQHHTTYDNTPVEGDNLYQVEVTLLGGEKKVSAIQTVNFKGLVEARIFPNPAIDAVQIDLSQYNGSNVSMFIYNQFGQTLRTIQVGIASKNAYEVDLSGIETGTYTVRIVAKGKRDLTKRLVIAK